MYNIIKPYLIWLATTILSLILIITNQNPQGEALRGRLSDLISIGVYPVASLLKGMSVWQENNRLREILAQMSLELASSIESRTENEILRDMLGFKKRSDYEITAAEVIGLCIEPGVIGLLINKGTEDSINVNQAVISPQGVIGRIRRAGKSSAVVQLLTDPNLGIAGKLLTSREHGIIHAAKWGRLVLDGVPVSTEVTIGDTIVTSGLGGVFPSGLMVGIATNVKPAPNGWLWIITIEPKVEFGRLEEVFVVQETLSDQ